MEIFDIVDEKGIPTGELIERSEAHLRDIRHRTAHVWVVRQTDGRYEVLLQKRAACKESFPGCYDTSSAGHIHAGDEPLPSALRELEEELGIRADESELSFAGNFVSHYERVFYDKPFRDNEYTFVYVYDKPVEIEALKLQADEVESVKWFDIDQVSKAIEPPRDARFCVPQDGFAVLRAWVEMKPVKQEQI
jgi:isopentenyldiphosphate isomerase